VSDGQKTVVSVEIAGEEYTIRAEATPEYTRECAEYVDRAITDILAQGSLLQAHKAAILAALAITDQLFQARREADSLRENAVRSAERIISDIESRLS
jgi:cell division protein ZapA